MPQKHKAIRFSKGTIQWLRSYLSEQVFLVNSESKPQILKKSSCGVLQGSILGPLFLICKNNMLQAAKSTLLLHAGDSCISYQPKELDEIKKQLNKDFENIYDWLVDNKLSIHFGEDKAKSILFANKRRSKNVHQLNIRYKQTNIKQHLQVTYLRCVLDKAMGESMTLKVIKK